MRLWSVSDAAPVTICEGGVHTGLSVDVGSGSVLAGSFLMYSFITVQIG